jgi:hypothetical protein
VAALCHPRETNEGLRRAGYAPIRRTCQGVGTATGPTKSASSEQYAPNRAPDVLSLI